MSDEIDLLARLQRSERAAFAELVEQHSAVVYTVALRLLGEPAEAEEVLQDTFLQVVRHIGGFRGESSLHTWLHRIATNQALMRLRRVRPATVPLEDVDAATTYAQAAPLVDWSTHPESEFLSQEARQEMEAAVRDLPETLRVVFVLRDIEGLSTSETAEALGLSISAAKSRLLRARLALRDRLSVYFAERLTEKTVHHGDPS